MIFEPGEQATLEGDAVFEGVGVHSGEPCVLRVFPAEADTGIVFRRGAASVRAEPGNVTDVSRGTTIGAGGATFVCVEHLLSALAGAGVDNAVCELDGPELPALDGSAGPYVSSFGQVGVRAQGRERRCFSVKSLECFARKDAVMVASPSAEFEISYLLRYDSPVIGMSFRKFSCSKDSFGRDIAPARTFGLVSEAEALRSAGLAKGASEENVLVVYDDHVRPALRFSDEFVRHKLLDMLGDLALAGGAISGTVFGVATGHWANVEMARRLRKE